MAPCGAPRPAISNTTSRLEANHDAPGRDHAQLRTRLWAVRGTAPVGARLLARLGPPPHHRASAGPQAVRPTRRFSYAYSLRDRLPASIVRTCTVQQVHGEFGSAVPTGAGLDPAAG